MQQEREKDLATKSTKETSPSPQSVSASDAESERDLKGCSDGEEATKNGSSSPLARLMTRTGYSIVQQNGQRRYGPPPTWDGSPPKRGCEIFVGKIPRDCFEDELVPVFEKAGPVYEMRLMMDYNGQNRGYAFVVYCKALDAKDSVKILNNYEIRKGRTLGVCMSVDNCRLFVGGIPKRVTKEDIREEMEKVTEGVMDVIVYPSASDKTKNRGFAFVEYESHRAAAMARRKLMNGRIQLWNHPIAVDWAEPELEVDEEIMAQVKVLYVRNLMLTTTEAQIMEVFSAHAPVERVKKIRDYAFVHFHSRIGALTTMELLNGTTLDGAVIEVTLAKPVDKETQVRNSRQQRSLPPAISTYGFVPVDYPVFPTIYPSYFPSSPKFVPRNSMGAKVIRSPRNSKGKSRNFYPISFGPQIVFPASPVHGPYMPQYFESPKRPQMSDEAIYEVIPGVDVSPAPPHQAPPPQHTTPPSSLSLKPQQPKTVIQLLEEICLKSSWGQPLYFVHSTSPDGQFLQYKVSIPALGTTYIPSKFSRSMEEAQFSAAEYALIQLGCPLEATGLPPHRAPPPIPAAAVPPPPALAPGDTLALGGASPYSHHSFLNVQAAPKQPGPAPPTWSPDPTLFTGYEAAAFGPPPPPHSFPHTELYHRNF